MKGKAAASILYNWWHYCAVAMLSYEKTFFKKAAELFHLKPHEFISFNNQFGHDFENFAEQMLKHLHLDVKLYSGNTHHGLSGNKYEFDLIGQSEGSTNWPKGNYYIECKFSNPYSFVEKTKIPKREVLKQEDISWFRSKCLDVLAAEKPSEKTYGIFLTNRKPEKPAVQFAATYGILLLSVMYPPINSVSSIASKKQKCWSTAPREQLEIIQNSDAFFCIRGDKTITSDVPADELFEMYFRWIEKLESFINTNLLKAK